MAKTVWHDVVFTIKEGEAYGIWLTINWTKELNIPNVIFEMNCKTVVDDINSTKKDASEYGSIILDCKNNLLILPQPNNVVFVKRQVNMVAHSLVRVALLSLVLNVLFFSVSDCIASIIINEIQ